MGIQKTYLEKYVNDPKGIRLEVAEHHKVSKDTAKQLIIRLMFGGTYYAWIKQNNLDIASYTSYAPSCIELYATIQKLNVNSNDSILDIGSGRGYALTIFHKFPFKKITGIEINDEDVGISKQNLDILNLKSINIIHDDIFNFTEWDNYNYFYFY